jgi:hypothetical protein
VRHFHAFFFFFFIGGLMLFGASNLQLEKMNFKTNYGTALTCIHTFRTTQVGISHAICEENK